MNKIIPLTEIGWTLKTALDFLSPFALKLNEKEEETKVDFETSKRTGQCHAVIGTNRFRVGVTHVPEGLTDSKDRYNVVANIKFNCLLENPAAETTKLFVDPDKRIFQGGIRYWKIIVCVSGFHPKIDEALAIIIAWMMDSNTDIYAIADSFGNSLVSKLISMAGGIEKINTTYMQFAEIVK